jgi:hypothetical protein
MFYFSLAESLGMPVGEMLQRMTSLELAEWMAYNRVRAAEYAQESQRVKQEANVRSKH